MKCLVPLLLLINVVNCYKFLVYSPLSFHSMCKWMGTIADILTEAGHDVTVLMPVIDPLLMQNTGVKVTKKRILVPGDEDYANFVKTTMEAMFGDTWTEVEGPLEVIRRGKYMSPLVSRTCDMLLNNKTLLVDLMNENFDVAIAEPFLLCGFGLFEHLNITKVIATSSATHFERVSYALGEPMAFSYVPALESNGEIPKSIWKRAYNAFESYASFKMVDQMYQGEAEILRKHFGEGFSGIEEVLARSSFHFTRSIPYLDFPKPMIYKTVDLGGIVANNAKTAVLDEDFERILSLRPHTVLISFGTVCLSKNMPERYKQSIIEVMKSFPEVTFIWKYEEETDIAKHLPNVHMVKWQPQTALLADPGLSMFITHAGLGSTLELAHSGKPAITIPVFCDQSRNAAMLARHGGSISLQKENLESPDKLRTSIKLILNNKSFATSAERLQRKLNEQPMKAKEQLILHAEFVAKFGPLTMLDPYGRNLSIFEYYFLDIAAVLVSAFAIILFVFIRTLRRCTKSENKNKTD